MLSFLSILFWATLKLLAVVLGGVYMGLVLMTFRTDGPRYQARFDLGAPARSLERFLVWLGVMFLAASTRAGLSLLTILSEASAEVGEWYLRQRGVEAHSEFRSRYL